MKNIAEIKEDITTKFYYKKAVYVSSITGGRTDIEIKRVYNKQYSFGISTIILTTHGIEYDKNSLTDFSI